MSDVIGILENIGSNASLNAEVIKDSTLLLRDQNLNQHTCSVLLSNNANQIGLLTGARTKVRCIISVSKIPEEFILQKANSHIRLNVVREHRRCQEVA